MSQDNRNFFNSLKNAVEEEPTKLAELVAEAGSEYFMKDAAASLLEETKKSLLAKFSLDYLAGGIPSDKPGVAPKAMPQTQADARALADPRFEAHIEMMVAARRDANLARVRYDMGRAYIELQRSTLATKRQEMLMNGTTGREMQRG